MFQASWTTPRDSFAGTLRFTVDPRRRGLGQYTDVEGVQWDIRGIIGKYVQARRVGRHPNYYSTATSTSFGSSTSQGGANIHTWEPYEVEIVSTDS
jgi:hypothetical protein